MNRALQIVKVAALIAAIAALVAVAFAGFWVGQAEHSRRDLQHSLQDRVDSDVVSALIASANAVTRHADISLTNADNVSAKAADAAEASRKAADKTTQMVADTNAQINQKLLPAITGQVNELGGLTRALNTGVTKFLDGLDPVLREATDLIHAAHVTVEDVDKLVRDPNWPLFMEKMVATIEEARKSGVHVEGILEGLQHPEKPSAFIRALSFALSLLRVAGPAGQLFK